MASWPYFIWIKRFLPLIIIFVAVAGYFYISDFLEARGVARDREMALLTAKIWVASAVYRDDPMGFLEYRDSLLAGKDIDREEIFEYIKIYEEKKEKYYGFTRMVTRMVDSLSRKAALETSDTLSSP